MKGPESATFEDVSRIVLSRSKKAARTIASTPALAQSTGALHRAPLCTASHLGLALSTGARQRVDETNGAGASSSYERPRHPTSRNRRSRRTCPARPRQRARCHGACGGARVLEPGPGLVDPGICVGSSARRSALRARRAGRSGEAAGGHRAPRVPHSRVLCANSPLGRSMGGRRDRRRGWGHRRCSAAGTRARASSGCTRWCAAQGVRRSPSGGG